jgi:hypothetical protein
MSPIALYTFLSHLVSVLTVVSYGMLSVWAVYSPWHWFWRVALIGASLGALVALPGNELLFPCAFAIPVFGIALAILRSPARPTTETTRRCWPRIGLRDSFLLTIVVAALLTVAVNAPTKTPRAWIISCVDGLVFASMGLACAWLALGRSNWMLRLLTTPFVVAYCFVAVRMWLMSFSSRMAREPTRGQSFLQQLQSSWDRFWQNGWSNWNEWIVPTTLGMVAFVSWLLIIRRTSLVTGRDVSHELATTEFSSPVRRTNRWR